MVPLFCTDNRVNEATERLLSWVTRRSALFPAESITIHSDELITLRVNRASIDLRPFSFGPGAIQTTHGGEGLLNLSFNSIGDRSLRIVDGENRNWANDGGRHMDYRKVTFCYKTPALSTVLN